MAIYKKGSVKELLKAIRREYFSEYLEHLKEFIPKILNSESKTLCQLNCFKISKSSEVFSFPTQHEKF